MSGSQYDDGRELELHPDIDWRQVLATSSIQASQLFWGPDMLTFNAEIAECDDIGRCLLLGRVERRVITTDGRLCEPQQSFACHILRAEDGGMYTRIGTASLNEERKERKDGLRCDGNGKRCGSRELLP